MADSSLLASSRREAWLAFCLWLVALIYTVGVSYTLGYHQQGQPITFVIGFPAWVFWGIVVPWLACVVLSALFAFRWFRDEDLGVDPSQGDPSE